MEKERIKIFKYNMSFYYQSTIIYFAAFVIYIIIRGEFVEDSFRLITKDPIIYFFGFIVLFSLISLLYNVYKNKHLEISDEEISFVNQFKRSPLRIIGIKFNTRKRPVVLRPSDYENSNELLSYFIELKNQVERR